MNKDLDIKNLRMCEICRKQIEIKKEKIKTKNNSYTELSYSDDGVYFEEGNALFCNKHWQEMTNHIFKK